MISKVVLCASISFIFLQAPVFAKPSVNDIFEQASKYTVKIRGFIEYPHIEDDEAGTWLGSGFLVDRHNGWIVTNAHVSARGDSTLSASFYKQNFVSVKKIFVDTHLDIAVLKIKPESIPEQALEADLSCETFESPGTPVGAYGHPFGYEYTSTRGIISGIDYLGYESYTVDAPINEGNSGGPLINLNNGKVVGVNAESLEDSQNLNFAIQMPYICKVLKLLDQEDNPLPPVLPFTQAYYLDSRDKVYVGKIVSDKKSGGLKQGDLVVSVVGSGEVRSFTDLVSKLRGRSGEVDVSILRENQPHLLTIWVEHQSSPLNRDTLLVSGILFGYGTQLDIKKEDQPITVYSVHPASVAASNSWEDGLILESVDGIVMTDIEKLREYLRGVSKAVFIIRDIVGSESNEYKYYRFELPISSL